MSVDFLMAVQIVNKRLLKLGNDVGMNMKIIEDATIERPYYWVFFYNSKLYLKSGNLSYALAGNSPFIVDKIHGNIYETGTAFNIEYYMEKFEKDELPVVIARQ